MLRQRSPTAPIATAAVLATVAVLLRAAAALSISDGTIEVLSYDFKGRRSGQEVYLHSSAGPGGHTGSRYRLEGPGTAGLRTGQRVRVAGQVIPARAGAGSGIASASAAGGASPQQLLVSSLSLLEDPSAAAQRAVVLAPARRGTSRRLAQQQGLPTVQLSADTASINTLVIPLSFEGCPAASGGGTYLPPWWTQQDVEGVMFEDGRPGDAWRTVGGRFRSCSHGRSSLTRANSLVMPILRLNCSGESSYGTPYGSTTCEYNDFMGWYEAGMDAAAAAGIDLSQFRYKLLVLPPHLPCGFIGVAHLGCYGSCGAWVQGETLMGASRAARNSGESASHPALHEMGHNLFMHHGTAPDAFGAVQEYGDLSDAVGQCCTSRCYNLPHAFQLGWAAPQLLDGASLPAGKSRTVSFAAHSRSRFSGLLVNATWAQGAPSLYVSYRLAERGDRSLLPDYIGKVSVHTWPGRQAQDADKTLLVKALPRGAALTHAASGLTIKVAALDRAAGIATVVVTRAPIRRPRRLPVAPPR